jgi:ABC-type uncharacterized transport system permease subunit
MKIILLALQVALKTQIMKKLTAAVVAVILILAGHSKERRKRSNM